jgi:hypothetical protein
MQKLLILLACVVFFSCKPSKTITEYKELVRIDTIQTVKTIEKYKAFHDTLTIVSPCDSNGILTNFYSKIATPQGQVIIRSVNGNIQARVDLDSMRNEIENNYRNSQVKSVQYRDKEVIKYRVPMWVVWLLLIQFIALVAYLYLKFGLNAIK